MLFQRRGEHRFHLLFMQLRLELHQELVYHAQNHLMVKCPERDRGVEPVAELGGKDSLDLGHLVAGLPGRGETHRCFLDRFLSGVGSHDDHHVTEICFAPVVIGQCAVVHDLQQDVVDVGMRFFDFVEQQDTVRLLGDGLGHQSTLIETNVPGRRTDQARYRVTFHVFRHVETHELVAEAVRQLLGNLRFADACRTRKKEAANGLGGIAQAGTGHLDGPRKSVDRRILAKNHRFQVTVQVPQVGSVIGGDVGRGYARNLGDDLFDVDLANQFLLPGLGQDPLRSSRFVDDIKSPCPADGGR
jgi:hypothetical protein